MGGRVRRRPESGGPQRRTRLHYGIPSHLEVFLTLFGGFGFGWLAWWTNSFYYVFLIHWLLLTLSLLFGFKSNE